MSTLKDIKEKISIAHKAIAAAQEELVNVFKLELADLIKEYKEIDGNKFESIYIGINNHEFNDGDKTYFGLRYDDLTLNYSDLMIETSYGDEKEAKNEKIREKFVKFFGEFEVGDFYESLLGDVNGSVSFRLSNGKVKFD